jgi:PIN domain nuclease of toxin-antitoxin system
MRLLLDTHVLLWAAHEPERLSDHVRGLLLNTDNQLYFSMASCWEISVKQSLGKLHLAKPLEHLITDEIAANGLRLWPIELSHLVRVGRLPFLHRDPFDRLLVAQAQVEDFTLVSKDSWVAQYGVATAW